MAAEAHQAQRKGFRHFPNPSSGAGVVKIVPSILWVLSNFYAIRMGTSGRVI